LGELSTLFNISKVDNPSVETSIIMFDDICTIGKWDKLHSLIEVSTVRKTDEGGMVSLLTEMKESQVKVLLGTSPFVLLQDEEFNVDNLDAYFEHISPLFRNKKFSYEYKKLSGQKRYLVYAIDQSLQDVFKLSKFRREHLIAILANELNIGIHKDSYAVHIDDTHLSIVIQKDRETIFANTFECQNKEDFLYYILMTLKEFNFDLEKTNGTIFGRVDQKSSIYTLLTQYLGELKFANKGVDFLAENDQYSNLCQDLFLCRKCV